MLTLSDLEWAQLTFSKANLGDVRRVKRLVQIACDLAANIGESVSKACASPALLEGAYRLIRNPNVTPDAIAEAGFATTAELAQSHNVLLALEDSTALSYKHPSVLDELGHLNNSDRVRGFTAHSILLFAPQTQEVVGLIEQQRWCRDVAARGQHKNKTNRRYQDKEAFKWEAASEAMATRLGETLSRVISVCDRESDIYQYLQHKIATQQRFVVRSTHNRRIEESTDFKLHEYHTDLSPAGQREVNAAQRGGRKARNVTLDVFFAPVTLMVPQRVDGEPLSVNYVSCIEQGNGQDPLTWHILTSEPVETAEDAERFLDYYLQRWLVEEFHKAWKTGGTDVEDLRLQSRDNLERVAVIKAFVAVRLLQLRGYDGDKADESCETIFSPTCWKLLWKKVEKKPLPKEAPTTKWARIALARLGGWHDSKRTGKPGWAVLWDGWHQLGLLLEGYQLMAELHMQDQM